MRRFFIDPDFPIRFIPQPSRALRKITEIFPNICFLLPGLHSLWKHRNDYDILYGPLLMESGLLCGLATLFTGKPSLVKLGSAGRYGDVRRALRGPLRPLRRAVFMQITKFVCLTKEIENELLHGFRLPHDKLVLIRNGVDTHIFRPVASEQKLRIRENLGLKISSKIVLCVGRLEKKKRVDFLLKAWRSVIEQKGAVAHLLIVGDGTLRNSLEELSNRLKITDNVTFYGSSEDISLLMQAADLFVLPSVSEGLANVFLEAMASGLPLITTRTLGNAEILTHGDNAMLFPEEKLDALSESIIVLVENGALAKRMGLSARKTVEKHFDIEKIARQYMLLYHRTGMTGFAKRNADANNAM